MPSTRPRDEITAAVIDAVTSLEMAEDGSVPRSELKDTAVRREVFANLALARYLEAHPGLTNPSEGERYNAIEDGLRLLAGDAVIWLLSKGHLEEPEPGRIRLTSKPVKINGKKYAPGTNREADLFHSMRRVTPARVDLIRESIAELGDLRRFFPVLVDTEGEVVDGRHRRAVDANWPASQVTVPADARLAVATAANRSNAWTRDDWQRLRIQREHVTGQRETTRILAKLALLEDASRSDREISRLIGAGKDGKTVGTVRGELESTAEIPQYLAQGGQTGGQGITQGRPHVLTEEMQQQVDALVAQGSTRNEVMAETGLKANTAQRAMEKARERQPRPPSEPELTEESHAHDWGPHQCAECGGTEWMRQCAECGETEEKATP